MYINTFRPVLLGAPLQLGALSARLVRLWVNPALPGTVQIVLSTPYYLRNGKATDFKFGGYIHRAYPNKSPLKIFQKMERGHIQGLSKLF